MNTLDLVILVVGVGSLMVGYFRGFVNQLVSIAGLFLAFFAAYYFFDDITPWVRKLLPLSSWESYDRFEQVIGGLRLDDYIYRVICFALLFFGVKIGLSIAGQILHVIAKVPGLNFMNRWSGAALGLFEAAVLVIIAVNVMDVLPSDTVQQLLAGSDIAGYIQDYVPSVTKKLQELWKNV